ncbi:MAG: phosphatase PAP2 family protein [Ardenticatenaceae bacterium]|nr:phosphatase PAP2 family protein [Ardenticatenaceae bacterium]
MNPTFEWGLDFMRALQQAFGATGVDLAQVFTFMGNQEFYLLLFPLLFWCIDGAVGARVTILYLLSVVLNVNIKDAVAQPRPYQFDPAIAQVDPAGDYIYGEGYGMPSGHAQWSITIWGALAAWVKRGWFWATAAVLVLLIGLSRLVLGLHFPTQVLAGWGIGAVVIVVYLALMMPIERWLETLRLEWQMLLAVMLPLGLLLIHPVADTIAAMAVLIGLGVGLALTHRFISYSVNGAWPQRAARYVVGIVVLLAIYLGLSAIFPGEGEPLYIQLRFVRYTLMGLWISYGAPWLFTRIRLAPIVEPA